MNIKEKWQNIPAEAAKDADYVFTCVGNNDLEKLHLVKKEFLKQLKKVRFILITLQRLQQLLEKL